MAKDTTGEAFVQFDRVQKSYDGETLVVKDLNLEMPRGEFLTMLGPSGSGKTTCLMMLAGFETATHGDILLDGVSINNIPPHKRGIGMVFQNYALFPHMTIAENLSFPLEVRKMGKSDREEKVKRALDMVEMGAFGGRRPAQLTSRLAVPRNRSPRPCRIEGWADRIDRVARTARRQAVVGGGRRGSAEPRTAGAVGAASSDDFLPNPCTATSSRCPCGSRHAGTWALLRRLRGFLPPLQR